MWYLKVCNDKDSIGLMCPANVSTQPVVFDIVQERTNILPLDPGAHTTLHTSLQNSHTPQMASFGNGHSFIFLLVLKIYTHVSADVLKCIVAQLMRGMLFNICLEYCEHIGGMGRVSMFGPECSCSIDHAWHPFYCIVLQWSWSCANLCLPGCIRKQ